VVYVALQVLLCPATQLAKAYDYTLDSIIIKAIYTAN